jgi:hypothetical protein
MAREELRMKKLLLILAATQRHCSVRRFLPMIIRRGQSPSLPCLVRAAPAIRFAALSLTSSARCSASRSSSKIARERMERWLPLTSIISDELTAVCRPVHTYRFELRSDQRFCADHACGKFHSGAGSHTGSITAGERQLAGMNLSVFDQFFD